MSLMQTLGKGLYAAGGGDLASYMKQIREKEDQKLQAESLKSAIEAYDSEGAEGLGKYISEHADNEYALDAALKVGSAQTALSGLNKGSGKSNTLFDMYRGASDENLAEAFPTKETTTGWGPWKKTETTPGIDQNTLGVIKGIKSVDDLDALLENRDALEESGVDLESVFNYFRK